MLSFGFVSGHDFSRGVNDGKRIGLQSACENSISKLSPAGTAELSPGRSPGLDLKGRPVPQGRLEIGRDAFLDNLQPSLRDSIMFHDVPRTSVLG